MSTLYNKVVDNLKDYKIDNIWMFSTCTNFEENPKHFNWTLSERALRSFCYFFDNIFKENEIVTSDDVKKIKNDIQNDIISAISNHSFVYKQLIENKFVSVNTHSIPKIQKSQIIIDENSWAHDNSQIDTLYSPENFISFFSDIDQVFFKKCLQSMKYKHPDFVNEVLSLLS
jgi:hypothetical protein